MAFTKITHAGIGSTGTVLLENLQVIGVGTFGTLSVGGTVSIGGTLTYEDVTNIDSVGLITARNGIIVGGGVTISKDGDIFATGVTTATSFVGDGSALTGVASTENIRTNTNATFLQNVNVSGTSTIGGDVNIADTIVHTGDTNTKIRFPSNDVISFETSGSEGARLDAGRRFLIGSTTARTSGGAAYAHLQVEGTDSPGAEILVIRNSNDSYASTLGLVKTRGTSDGAVTTVADNDKLGQIQFRGADGSDIYSVAASIHGEVDGSPSDGTDMPGALVFGTTADGSASPTERLRIASNGRVNIGSRTTTPDELVHIHTASGEANVHIEAATNARVKIRAHSGESIIQFADAAASNPGEINYTHSSDAMSFRTNNSVQATINSSGTLHLGATSYGGGGSAPAFYVSSTSGRQVKIHNTNSSTSSLQLTNAATGQGDDNGFQLAALSSGAAYINNAESAQIYFSTNGAIRATISGTAEEMVMGATDGFGDYSLANGIFLAYATSSYSSQKHVIKGIHANTSFSETGGGLFFLGCRRSSTAAYTMAGWYSGDGSGSVANDRQFRFVADGNAYADASWNGGGADYAEFFEWLDGNNSDEDRKGISVVLDNGKIRASTGSDNTDNIIGVISAAPVVVGDSASERWKEKWITDDFGGVIEETYTITEWYDETEKKKVNYSTDLIPSDVTVGVGSSVLSTDENGNAFTRKKLNPSWDSTATYIPRKDRKEWDIVGLMGKLKVKSDQPVGTKWIKMREVSASVHEYLVR